jgi:hypothetical protein
MVQAITKKNNDNNFFSFINKTKDINAKERAKYCLETFIASKKDPLTKYTKVRNDQNLDGT